jgi:hypothetical protein
MRLSLLMFTAILAAAPAAAQPAPPSTSPAVGASTTQDFDLPVSLDRIRGKLEQPPAVTLEGLNDIPNFKVEVQEKQKLEDLLAAIFKDVKKVYVPAEGVEMQEMERNWSQALSENPLLEQPYSGFSGHEIVAITVENVVGRWLAGPAMRALSSAQRAAAERAARDEVRTTIAQYCAAQPNHGAGIEICGPQFE